MASTRAHQEYKARQEQEEDHQFLTGWGYKRDVQGTHYATSGNLGKMAGPGFQDYHKKSDDAEKMMEVWQKTNMVKQLKQNL